jgi:hypothetical protein
MQSCIGSRRFTSSSVMMIVTRCRSVPSPAEQPFLQGGVLRANAAAPGRHTLL